MNRRNNDSSFFEKRRNSCHHIVPRTSDGPDIPANKFEWAEKVHKGYH